MLLASKNTKHQDTGRRTHQGAIAYGITPLQELQRTMMGTLLWEGTFFEDGKDLVTRLGELVPKVDPQDCYNVAVDARKKGNLRHIPLALAVNMLKLPTHKHLVGDLLYEIICRPDELCEFVALYWDFNGGRRMLPNQARKGLGRAFTKFDEYQLSKYNRDRAVKLKDVLFLCHAKPKDDDQAALWKRLVDDKLETADTWETKQSSGEGKKTDKDKKAVWLDLIHRNKLGAMALIKNLRNMKDAGVERSTVLDALLRADFQKVFPYRFLSAAKEVPGWEDIIDAGFLHQAANSPKMKGKTIIVIDTSGSMTHPLSGMSGITRWEAAACLGAVIRSRCEEVSVYATANLTCSLPPRSGMAFTSMFGYGQLSGKIGGGGIYLTKCMADIKSQHLKEDIDRIIVLTDEQDCSSGYKDAPSMAQPFGKRNFMVNVAGYQNGIGYGSKWVHVDGFSEHVARFIMELEQSDLV